MINLAYFVSHPIQYQAPLLRLIASDPDINLKVFFYSDFSLKGYQDPGFDRIVKWDVPLIEGYNYSFLDCWGSNKYKNIIQQPVARNIFNHLKIGNFDAVWVHGWSHICSLQAVAAAEKLKISVLLRGDSNVLSEDTQSIKYIVKRKVLDTLFSKISRFLYIGKLNYQFYRRFEVRDEQLFVMPYAVDNHYFQKQAHSTRSSQESLRKSLNLESDRPIILYAAKLIEKKRPQDLLAAYRLLSVDGVQEPEPYLLFVGDGVMRLQLEQEARATGWQSIRFLGFRNQSQMPAMYDLCDVFVLPSSYEAWGLAVNEVMNVGKAVVVSDQVGCAPDLVIQGQNGQIFPVGNTSALAEALQWGIANAKSAGNLSLQRIQTWSFQEDLQGLKQALYSIKY